MGSDRRSEHWVQLAAAGVTLLDDRPVVASCEKPASLGQQKPAHAGRSLTVHSCCSQLMGYFFSSGFCAPGAGVAAVPEAASGAGAGAGAAAGAGAGAGAGSSFLLQPATSKSVNTTRRRVLTLKGSRFSLFACVMRNFPFWDRPYSPAGIRRVMPGWMRSGFLIWSLLASKIFMYWFALP